MVEAVEPKPGSLELYAQLKPDALALCEVRRRFTWAQWNDAANRLADALHNMAGVGPDDRVAVCMDNRIEWFITQAATNKLGALLVPVSPRLTPAEVHYIVADSQAKAFLFDSKDVVSMARVWTDQPLADGDQGPRTAVRLAVSVVRCDLPHVSRFERVLCHARPIERVARHGPRSIVYTSGTTGRPRGVVPGRTRKSPTVPANPRTMDIRPQSLLRNLLGAPLVHAAGQGSSRTTLGLGGTVYITPRFDAETTLRMIERERITMTFLVPTMLNRIVSLPEETRAKYDVSSIEVIFTGASPCPQSVKEKVIGYFGPNCLYESYGSTEVGLIARMRPGDHLAKPGSCGQLLPGVTVRIVDEQGRPVAQGELGEIVVQTPRMIESYLNQGRPEDLRDDGFFAMGDIGYQDADGYLYIVDRKKDMIIAGGVNIYPAEIEAALRKHHAVFDAAVFGVPDADRGEQVHAVVECVPTATVDPDDLLAFVSDQLAKYKRPRAIEVVPELPRNATGKILKAQLRAPHWEAVGKAI